MNLVKLSELNARLAHMIYSGSGSTNKSQALVFDSQLRIRLAPKAQRRGRI
jgi:hypothetical protein